MLDSTLSKILTTKQVEKETQASVEDDQQNNAESSAKASSKAEAEVRIVVRFTVEEQIVYKGKVERVHQLESEELSRIVSRVAWDDTNESDQLASTETVPCLDQSMADTTDPPMDDEQHNQQKSPIAPSLDNSIPPEESLQEEADESPDHVQENTNSNNESSDHKAYTTTTAVPVTLPTCQVESLDQTKGSCDPNPTPDECDIYLERSSSPPHITGSPSTLIQNIDKQQECDENPLSISSIHTTLDTDGSNQHCTEYLVESQTVTDTLNDCVNTVDIESRREATIINDSPIQGTSECPKLRDEPECTEPLTSMSESKQYEAHKLNGLESIQSDTNSSILKGETSLTVSSENCIVTQLEANISLPNGSSSSVETNNISEARDPFEENSIPSESDAGGSNKRKSYGKSSNTATKRIRRTTNKEQRSLKTRTGSGTNVENTGRRQSTNIRYSNISMLDNQPTMQNKIFAKWTDNHFYPGTILKNTKDRKYVVGFFDGAQRNVSEADLIPLGSIEGRQVRVSINKNYCVNAVVHDQRSPINDQPMFDVEYQQDGVVRKCVPLKDIFLTGEQGASLISQSDRNSGASNFADVDLDNIIYEKRSRRFQDMEDFELTDNSSLSLSL